MKFIKELDYPFIVLILYIIKSVVLPGVIDLGVLVLLGSIFVLKYITTRYFDTKLQISGDALNHDRFKFVEQNSEQKFQARIEKQMEELLDEVSSVKQSVNLRNGYKK